jgi:hypothetical protein
MKMKKIFRKMNKKAEDTRIYVSVGLIFVFTVFLVGVYVGLLVFYGASIDVRFDESKIIAEKLIGAVSSSGYLKEEVLLENFDIINASGLNKELFYNGGMFFYSLIIFDGNKAVKTFSNGTKDFEVQCAIPGEKLADCYNKEFFVLNKLNPNQKFQIKILAGSNQQGAKI